MKYLFTTLIIIVSSSLTIMAQWESIPSPSTVNHLSRGGDYLFISSMSDSALIRHNINDNNQEIMYNPDDNLPFSLYAPKDIICIDSVVFYADDGYIYRTFDFGDTWEKCLDWSSVSYYFISYNNNLFVGRWRLILQSMDFGNTFEWFYYESYYTNTTLIPLLVKDSILYFTEEKGLVAKHLNGSVETLNSTEYFLYSMTARDSIMIGAKYGTVKKSYDNGYTWSIVPVPFSSSIIYDIKYHNDELFAIGTAGIYKSLNDGYNWVSISDNLPIGVSIGSIIFDDDHIYIGTSSHGTFRRPLNNNNVEGNIRATTFKIYPNPTIGKLIVEAESVENIEVIDINGTRVWHQPGSKSISKYEIDLSQLPKAIYFIEVTTENGSVVEKIMLE